MSHARALVQKCLSQFTILLVDRVLMSAALALTGPDFEDNVQIACAQAASLDLIVTRDTTGFAQSSVPVISPPDMVVYLPKP